MANPIDILASKTKGVEKSMQAHREGLVGVFQTLAKQHGEVAALIDHVKRDEHKRTSLWPKIRVALMAHEHGELDAVYPALGRYHGLAPYIARHAQEAAQLEATIQQLDAMAMTGPEWGRLFVTLGDLVVDHANEEEAEIFPAAMNAIGAERAKELDHDYAAAHKQAKANAEREKH